MSFLRSAKQKRSPLFVVNGAPSKPTHVVAVKSGQNTVVSWRVPVLNGGWPILSYTITSNTGLTATSTTNSYTFANLEANTYVFTVVAKNKLGTSLAGVSSPLTLTVAKGSLSFNQTNQFLSYSGVVVGTSAFTFEGWFYATNFNSRSVLFGAAYNTTGAGGLSIAILGVDRINIDFLGSYQIYYTVPIIAPYTVATISTNTWHHFAMVRNESNQEALFYDGIRSSSCSKDLGVVPAIDATNYKATLRIGAWQTGPNPPSNVETDFFGGYLSNLRIVAGSTVYDPNQATITVPTAPLTAIANTQFLLNTTYNSNFLKDSSTNNFTMTNNGGVLSSDLTPFS
jgi:hypothetical protein